ncbi:MAG: PAS domain-containing protein [Myxococcota bacterium]
MERQSRVVIVLVMAVFVVAAALWLWEPPDPRVNGGDTIVWELETDDVIQVELSREDETIVVVRDSDGWQLQQPIIGRADASEVEFVVVNLTRVRGARPLPGADASQFGLAPPLATLRVTQVDGTLVQLDVGAESPTGSGTYARLETGEVVLLPYSLADVIEIQVAVLRERRILAFDEAAVRRVTLEGANGTLEVTGSGTDWYVSGFGRANVLRAEDLIFNVRGTRFLSFSPDTAPDGIADAAFRVTVATVDDEVGFAVGESGPMGVYVRRDDGVAGYADPEALQFLGQGPLDVVQRDPFRLDPNVDDRITIIRGGAETVLTRTDDGWTGAADADALITALRAASITYLRSTVPTPGTERVRVTVDRDSGRHTEVMLFQDEGGYVVAQDAGGGVPFRVEGLTLFAAGTL